MFGFFNCLSQMRIELVYLASSLSGITTLEEVIFTTEIFTQPALWKWESIALFDHWPNREAKRWV